MSGWGLSVVAESAGLVALLVLAYETGGPGLVAGLGAVRALPVLIVGPLVIGRSDRGRRETWVVATLAVRAGLAGFAATLALLGMPIPALVSGAAASVLYTTHRPLNAALMPNLARTPSELTSANAASAFAENAGALVGPTLAGLGLVVAGPAAVLAGCGVVTLAAVVTVAGVRTSRSPGTEAAGLSLRVVVTDLSAGLRVLRRPPLLLPLTALQTAARGVLLVAVVVLAVDEFGVGDPGVGWLTAMLGVGGLLGALVAAWRVGSTSLTRAFVGGVALWGLPMLAAGLWTEPVVGFIAFAVVGLGNAILDVGVFTLVARIAPTRLMGRVFAAFEVVIVVSVTVGSLLAGALVPLLGVRPVLIGAGLVLVVAAAVSWAQAARVDRTLVAPANVEPMRACVALAGLPLVVIEHLAAAASARSYRAGETVIRQGDQGHEFFVVTQGTAEVDIDGTVVGRLGVGEGFGEVALLRRVPRTATVTAVTPLTTLVIAQTDFTAFVAGHSASAASLNSTVADRDRANRGVVGP